MTLHNQNGSVLCEKRKAFKELPLVEKKSHFFHTVLITGSTLTCRPFVSKAKNRNSDLWENKTESVLPEVAVWSHTGPHFSASLLLCTWDASFSPESFGKLRGGSDGGEEKVSSVGNW